jgi:sarcosine oxidase
VTAGYDAIVIGLGAVGSATAWQLARRGARVLGLDRHAPPHDRGSSHGDTRITRVAVGEGAEYVPLVRRSHRIWREIEAATGSALFVQTGGVVLGSPDGDAPMHGRADFVGHTIAVARAHGIAHQTFDGRELHARFPAFTTRGDERCYFEPEAGYLRPEACIAAQLLLARQCGARLLLDEPVLALDGTDGHVRVRTAQGDYEGAQAIVCAGAWLPEMLGAPFQSHLSVHRQALVWFEPRDPQAYAPGRFPVFIWSHGATGDDVFYGFPLAPGRPGVKVAAEQYAVRTTPETMQREVPAAEAAQVHARHVHGRLQGLGPQVLAAAACPYTVAPGSRFVVAPAARVAHTTVVSACSGHGFKHSAALGEALAQRTLEGRSDIDLEGFALAA